MDIEELKKKRNVFDNEIKQIVKDFENDTGLIVKEIAIIRNFDISDYKKIYHEVDDYKIVRINTTIEIPQG